MYVCTHCTVASCIKLMIFIDISKQPQLWYSILPS